MYKVNCQDIEGRCSQCGQVMQPGVLRQCGRNYPQPMQLGDYTEHLLASIGVTKERYTAAKELFGLPPTCNCDQRKEWLNSVSRWWRG